MLFDILPVDIVKINVLNEDPRERQWCIVHLGHGLWIEGSDYKYHKVWLNVGYM